MSAKSIVSQDGKLSKKKCDNSSYKKIIGAFRSVGSKLGLTRDHKKCSKAINGEPIEGFPAVENFDKKTRIFFRPKNYTPTVGVTCNVSTEEDYVWAAYQYSTTCTPELTQPAAIICPANGDIGAINAVVQYAYEHKLAVAVRSGGHSFGGFSSTKDDNIQIDMKLFKNITYDKETQTFTVGAGCTLGEMDDVMEERGTFAPHGMCRNVCIGGHVQSGGFSKDIGRSFGFFIDRVKQFDVILPPTPTHPQSELVTVTKPTHPVVIADWKKDDGKGNFNRNDELWFSMLGGSPGSFGVLTSVTFSPLFDADYPEARTLVHLMPYTKDGYEKLIRVTQYLGSRPDLPADFGGLSVAVFAGNPSTTDSSLNNMDAQMAEKHPEKYGPPFPKMPGAGIILTASWCNLKGKGQWDQEPSTRSFFEALDNVCLDIVKGMEINKRFEGWVHDKWSRFGPRSLQLPQQPHDWKKPIAISATVKMCGFAERNQAFPYTSASGIGPADMAESYPKWVTGIVDDCMINGKNDKGQLCVYVDNGTGLCGGNMSTTVCNNPATAMPHRDTGFMVIHYVHYENVVDFKDTDEWKNFSLKNCAKFAEGIGKQCKGNRRWNMFPNQTGPKNYHEPASDSNPNQIDNSMDALKHIYFDSAAQYNRVLQAKRIIDPNDVFTATQFGVGASRKYGDDQTEW